MGAEQLGLFQRLAPLFAPSPASHTRHVVLAGQLVTYALRRDRRRLVLRIDERGLRVGAPRHVPLAQVEAFIHQHADWVVAKLDEFARRLAPCHLSIHEGARLPLLGREARVRVITGPNRGYWRDGHNGDELWLAARPEADLSALTRRALQRRALEIFRPRLDEAVRRLGLPLPPLALSSARTRWGSCSAKSGIRLNWRLVHLPPPLIDYVIAHEAAHLVEMNHSPRFWALVTTLCPDWPAARNELKRQGASLPLI